MAYLCSFFSLKLFIEDKVNTSYEFQWTLKMPKMKQNRTSIINYIDNLNFFSMSGYQHFGLYQLVSRFLNSAWNSGLKACPIQCTIATMNCFRYFLFLLLDIIWLEVSWYILNLKNGNFMLKYALLEEKKKKKLFRQMLYFLCISASNCSDVYWLFCVLYTKKRKEISSSPAAKCAENFTLIVRVKTLFNYSIISIIKAIVPVQTNL